MFTNNLCYGEEIRQIEEGIRNTQASIENDIRSINDYCDSIDKRYREWEERRKKSADQLIKDLKSIEGYEEHKDLVDRVEQSLSRK